MEGALMWALVTTLVCGWGQVGANPFRVEPKDTTAALGETVVLPCILHNNTLSHCSVFWYRSDEQIYISRNHRISDRLAPAVQERYSVLGNRSSGVYSLQIRNVAESDMGVYKCTCFPRSHANTYFSPPAAIFIVARPSEQYPICRLREGTGPLMVGEKVSFLCESVGGKPSVALQWKRREENIVADFTFNPHSISVYHKTLTLEDSEEVLTCVASGVAMKTPRNCTIGPLSVISPLRIKTQKIIAKHGTRDESPRIVFTCNSNVNQTGLATMYNYTWYANSVRITATTPGFVLASHGMSVQVTDVSLFSQNIHIVCAAHGTQGSLGNVSTFLDVDSIAGFTAIPDNDHPTDPPNKGVVSISGNQYFDIRPFIYLVLGAFVLMTTMIAIVVCTPRSCCHSKSKSRLRRRDSQFTTMHYVQQPTGSPARAIAHQESLNLYESTADSDTESTRQGATITPPLSLTQQQKQQVQATLHVVVHSGNDPNNQTLPRGNSGTFVDDPSSIYQEMPLPPPPPPPHTNTHRFHPPKTANATLRTQTWGHSSCKSNPFNYEQVPPDLMHYDHLGGCYIHTLPMRPTSARPSVHQTFPYTPQYAQLNKFNHPHQGTVESMYENVPVPVHHARSLSLTTGY